MFARATVLGKMRTYLHLALKVRLSEKDPLTVWGKKLQVIVNDVARVIVKWRRSDHVRVEDLLKKAGLEGINAMVCSNSAMLAWRASSPLHDLFASMIPNGETRSKADGKLEIPAPNTKTWPSGTWRQLGTLSRTSEWPSRKERLN